MKHRKALMIGGAVAMFMLGACTPVHNPAPSPAPLSHATYAGDRLATNADLPDLLPPVANRAEADAQCVEVFSGAEQADCLHAAAAEWPEPSPTPTPTPAPVPPPAPEPELVYVPEPAYVPAQPATFDEAIDQCLSVYGFQTDEQSDCIGAAIVDWEMFWPNPEPEEDEPGWDCSVHGNKVCGPGVEP